MQVFTSVAANYLPKARVLASSLKRFHPEARFHLMMSDATPEGFCLEEEPFDSIIFLEDLPIENLPGWIFSHSVVELCTAVKGFACRWIRDRFPGEPIFYFDPDIAIFSPLDELLAELQDHSIVLTPHQTAPEETTDAVIDNEICSLRHGVYNLGFLGVGTSAESERFIDWWAERLREFCYDNIPDGLFTDQRWIDLAPALFSDVGILRAPVYNISTWNLTHRKVTGSIDEGVYVNGQPLCFYHFSGFDSGDQKTMLTKYADGSTTLWDLREWYIEECGRHGQDEVTSSSWQFGRFDNGAEITGEQRVLYRSRRDLQKAFSDPFKTSDPKNSYYRWYTENHAFAGWNMNVSEAPQASDDCEESADNKYDSKPVQLHIMHSWGGGLEHWVNEYCRADSSRTNLIIKSEGSWGGFGRCLSLYDKVKSRTPISKCVFESPIASTATDHKEYSRALREILDRYGVGALFVSSLIGHSLDVLKTGLPTVVVCHDYHPFCPAIITLFRSSREADAVCTNCSEGRLKECFRRNAHNEFFRTTGSANWLKIRRQYVEAVCQSHVTLVTPCQATRDHLLELEPELENATFRVIPHGFASTTPIQPRPQPEHDRKLRAVVLGSLSEHKGRRLVTDALPKLSQVCEVFLLGCGESVPRFPSNAKVSVVKQYDQRQLPKLLQEIDPDFGLLCSVWPETFSYTLSELTTMGIPPVATNLGSFAERITHDVNGFLFEPDADSLLKAVRQLCAEPTRLEHVRTALRRHKTKTTTEMVADYHGLVPVKVFAGKVPSPSTSRFFVEFKPTDASFPSFLEKAHVFIRSKLARTSLLWFWEKWFVDMAACSFFGLARTSWKLARWRARAKAEH